jgi:hypothetical protein
MNVAALSKFPGPRVAACRDQKNVLKFFQSQVQTEHIYPFRPKHA